MIIDGGITGGAPAKAGDFATALYGGQALVGFIVEDGQGVMFLSLTQVMEDEPAPFVIDLDQLETAPRAIAGDVVIEPAAGPFGWTAVDYRSSGVLIVLPDGRLGISVKFRQTIARSVLLFFDLRTGQQLTSASGASGVAEWKLKWRAPWHTDAVEVVSFGR
jgi:hypothetical protein